jgi:hypothetical protein
VNIPIECGVNAVKKYGGFRLSNVNVKSCKENRENQICEYIIEANPKFTLIKAKKLLAIYIDLVLADELVFNRFPLTYWNNQNLRNIL